MSVSLEATFAAEEPSSYFLWPKSQFGLLSCISLYKNNRQAVDQQELPHDTKSTYYFYIAQADIPPTISHLKLKF